MKIKMNRKMESIIWWNSKKLRNRSSMLLSKLILFFSSMAMVACNPFDANKVLDGGDFNLLSAGKIVVSGDVPTNGFEEGSNIFLIVTVTGKKTNFEYSWEKSTTVDGAYIAVGDTDNKLNMTNLTKDDEGFYRVAVSYQQKNRTRIAYSNSIEVKLRLINIFPNLPLVANAGVDITVVDIDGNESEDVSLDALSTYDPDKTIVSYNWMLNGSSISMAAVLSYSFSVGSHTVTLTVVDNKGARSSDSMTVTVTPGDPQIPSVDLALGNGIAQLAWNPNSESNLSGYKLYMHDQGGQEYKLVSVIDNPLIQNNVVMFDVNGLDTTKVYTFSVTAYNDDGLESNFSISANKSF